MLYFTFALVHEIVEPEFVLGDAMASPTCDELRLTVTETEVADTALVTTVGVMLVGFTNCQMLKPVFRNCEPVPFQVTASVPEVSELFRIYQQSVTCPA